MTTKLLIIVLPYKNLPFTGREGQITSNHNTIIWLDLGSLPKKNKSQRIMTSSLEKVHALFITF